jgi:hypothetical protein
MPKPHYQYFWSQFSAGYSEWARLFSSVTTDSAVYIVIYVILRAMFPLSYRWYRGECPKVWDSSDGIHKKVIFEYWVRVWYALEAVFLFFLFVVIHGCSLWLWGMLFLQFFSEDGGIVFAQNFSTYLQTTRRRNSQDQKLNFRWVTQ